MSLGKQFCGMAAAATMLAGCVAVDAPPPAPVPLPVQGCDASRAAAAAGRPYSDTLAEAVGSAAGASVVRVIEPGAVYTQELNPQRLNLVLNRSEVIVEVRCG